MNAMHTAVRWLLAAAVVAAATISQPAAQSRDDFVPVTDAMLEDPAPGDWLMWRRTLDGWGYSPLDQIDRGNVGDLRMVWTRALAAGSQQGTPLAYGGVLYMPNPNDVIQAIDAVTGDLRSGSTAATSPTTSTTTSAALVSVTNRNIAIHGTRILDTSNDDYIFALDARDRRAGLGDGDPRLHREPGPALVGPDRRRRQGLLGTELPPVGGARGVRHRGPRRGDRRGAVAPAARASPRRARRRDLGRRALRGAGARGVVDGAQRTTPS